MLKLRNIEARYGDVQALRDVSITVKESECVALVGANGAGKSTVAFVAAGVKLATRGLIVTDSTSWPECRYDNEVAVRAGVVLAPEGRHLFAGMSVAENLSLGAYLSRSKDGSRQTLERVYGLLPVLYEKRNHRAGSLSGGQQQMVVLGRALMAQPRVLLLDEPFLGIAPLVVRELLVALKVIAADGTSVLLIEQSVHRAFEFSSYAYLMENGNVVMEGRPSALLADPRFVDRYIGL